VTDLHTTTIADDLPATVYDCWNTIGVEGNGSCRELVKYVHCRNCPVYSAAGLQLLDRPLTPEYRREWTEHFAREKKLGTPAKSSVVIFRVATEWLALPTSAFQEIASACETGGPVARGHAAGVISQAEHRVMHTLPHRRGKLVLGLVNVRGELTVCASLARLLGLGHDAHREKKSRTVYDRLLVTHWIGGRLAFPVEEVHGIHRFQKNDLRDPPATVSRSSLTYTQGVISWRDRTVGVLNADALFASLNRNLT
jgi:chemotaxis-related protein WspD